MVKVYGCLKIPDDWLPVQVIPGIAEMRIMGITLVVTPDKEKEAINYIKDYLKKNCINLLITLVDYELILEVEHLPHP